MLTKRIALILLLVTLLPVPALGSGVSGSTGLFHTPTADVMPVGVLGASIHFSENWITAGIGYGLLDVLEIGTAVRLKGGAVAQVHPFIKGQILRETRNEPGVAAGIERNAAYVVLSKSLAPLLRGHAGVGIGERAGLFGGFSYLVNPVVQSRPGSLEAPRILLVGEFGGAGLNAGARLSFAQGLDINVFLRNLSEATLGASWRTRF